MVKQWSKHISMSDCTMKKLKIAAKCLNYFKSWNIKDKKTIAFNGKTSLNGQNIDQNKSL